MQRVEQSDELVLAKVGGGEAVAGRHVVGRRGVRVEGVDVGQQRAHLRRHAGTKVLGGKAVKVSGKKAIYMRYMRWRCIKSATRS